MKTKHAGTKEDLGQKARGTTLVELIVYIAILSIVSMALVGAVNSILGSLAQLKGREEIAQTSIVTLERITREVRKAYAVDMAGSTLGSHPGTLVLNTTDLSGNPTTVTIDISGGKIMLQEGSSIPSPLSRENVTIDNLVFTRILGTNTEGVLVELTASKNVRGINVSKDYRTFIVLDG